MEGECAVFATPPPPPPGLPGFGCCLNAFCLNPKAQNPTSAVQILELVPSRRKKALKKKALNPKP